VKKGYFFKTCRVHRNAAGIQYDYKLYNKFGREVKLQERGWRKTLSFNFSLNGGGQERLDIHRVFAMSDRQKCNRHWKNWCQEPVARPVNI